MRPLALALTLVLSLAGARASASRSTYSQQGSGAKVFYLLLQDLGYRTARAFDPREIDPATRLLVVIGLPESREGKRLLEWASVAGRRLLLAPPLEEEDGLCRSFKLGALEIRRSHALVGWSSGQPSGPAGLKLRPSMCVIKAPTEATVLAGRPDQALVLDYPAGNGSLLVLAHEDLLVNDNLDRDDLAVLVRRWVERQVPPGQLVTFLEEKQGGKLTELVRQTNLALFALHGLAFLLLLYWALAPRFGDAFPSATSTRRAFAQHARALGALYRHRGASAHMLHQQYERFVARVTGRAAERSLFSSGGRRVEGRGPGRVALAAAVATRTGRDKDSVESLLAQLDRAVQEQSSKDPKQIQRHFRLSQSLAALQRVSAARAPGGSRARKGRSGIR